MTNTPRLFADQNVSIYKVQKDLKLDKSRLYRYCNGMCSVKDMKPTLLKKLAKYFEIDKEELLNKMIEWKEVEKC